MKGFDRDADTALTLLALVIVTAGAYLPWIRPRSEAGAVPDILLPEMNAGISGYSLLLVVAMLAVLSLLVVGRDRRRSLATALAGTFVFTVGLYYVLATPLIGFDATFVPTTGWYLTVAGGLLLAAVGLAGLVSSSR
ncbi:hypothetical protein [Natrononativus amylolyticus]|uniref:hypothetical protein n=1 Tax=Natrononativus amylolyticus TaxID=2963434 RepID=UPI0020CF6AE7|nr:hypothetical protein [Natrononativus amylolyticus]